MEEKRSRIDDHSLLLEAVREAELLLDYISRQGLKFDKKTVSAIVKAKHLFASGKWQPEDETEFWEAFNTAARSVSPVSVASIKATTDPPANSMQFRIVRRLSKGKYNVSAARWYAMQFSIRTLVILISLVILQIYWSSGVNMLAKLEKHRQALSAAWAAVSAKGGDVKKSAMEGDAEAKKILSQLRREKAGYDADLAIFENYWQPGCLKQAKNPDQIDLSSQKDRDSRGEDFINRLATVGVADLGLQVIQTNILPLLYGLLGAAAFVLRTLSKRIKNMTYVPAANTGFGLRIQLGALAGLAIGWFYTPDSLEGSSLSPLALAFLAGYSVELFFTAMDKLVFAFSGSGPKEPKKSDKTAGMQVDGTGGEV
jgi:hypothetical protein